MKAVAIKIAFIIRYMLVLYWLAWNHVFVSSEKVMEVNVPASYLIMRLDCSVEAIREFSLN